MGYDVQLQLKDAASPYLPFRAYVASWDAKLILSKH